MKNYEVKTRIRGLRLKGQDRTAPIPPGTVIALDQTAAARLVEIGALKETDSPATIELASGEGGVSPPAARRNAAPTKAPRKPKAARVHAV